MKGQVLAKEAFTWSSGTRKDQSLKPRLVPAEVHPPPPHCCRTPLEGALRFSSMS